ncbi:hypothetical protein BC939DRAFT_451353 [Gamsiella multidivaricata]|uniref:uncharacterized protein n=1 Tax=Gamsiella multidivaricata TaxID=101098 RepID=UPI0022209020|nr:uncharacterized protein BC939DRAFT_451353 [Gamsiella multidivaricata]KAI7823558.1 hypothetical protein BC939DRAFT_451353 [Gamsiella multidivaricata]
MRCQMIPQHQSRRTRPSRAPRQERHSRARKRSHWQEVSLVQLNCARAHRSVQWRRMPRALSLLCKSARYGGEYQDLLFMCLHCFFFFSSFLSSLNLCLCCYVLFLSRCSCFCLLSFSFISVSSLSLSPYTTSSVFILSLLVIYTIPFHCLFAPVLFFFHYVFLSRLSFVFATKKPPYPLHTEKKLL